MGVVSKTVYTVNAQTNAVDEWICIGEMTGIYHGETERLCFLEKDRKRLVLPKRYVYTSRDKALEIANKR